MIQLSQKTVFILNTRLTTFPFRRFPSKTAKGSPKLEEKSNSSPTTRICQQFLSVILMFIYLLEQMCTEKAQKWEEINIMRREETYKVFYVLSLIRFSLKDLSSKIYLRVKLGASS